MMVKDCHRCSTTLPPPGAYCPNCGAPQMLYDATADGPENENEGNPHALREIQWPAAIGAAVTFAVPVGVLCSSVIPILSAGCCLWVVGGAVCAVWLYQRRSASRMLPRPVGVRIGTIIGLMAAAVAAAFNGGALVFQRYVLHNGDAIEKAYQSVMEQVSATSAQLSTSSPAESRQVMQFLSSPDGQAASALMSAVLASMGILLFSMIGGALGTRIFSERNPSPHNS
jgi:hypothetical protein